MSVCDRRGVRVPLPQLTPDTVTVTLLRWAADDPSGLRLRYIAALALRELGWTNQAIGQVLGHPRGHVARILRRVRMMVREHFSPPAGVAPVTTDP